MANRHQLTLGQAGVKRGMSTHTKKGGILLGSSDVLPFEVGTRGKKDDHQFFHDAQASSGAVIDPKNRVIKA